MEHLKNLVFSVLEALTKEAYLTIGLGLLFLGYNTVLVVNIVYKKEWDIGSKGENGFWDMPEQLMTLNKYIIPLILLSACFLPTVVKPPDMAWVFMLFSELFGLTGRWGLEWLERMKGSVTSIFNKKVTTEIQQQEVSNESKSKVDNTADNSGIN